MPALLLLLLVVAGRWSWYCIGPKPGAPESETTSTRRAILAEESFCGLVSGFALSSAGLFLLAHFGSLSTGAVSASAAIGVAVCLFVCQKRRLVREALAGLPQDLALGVVLIGLTVLFGALLPPIDTTLAASDSSVYVATAHQLARHGTTLHGDALVAEMTVAEREVLLGNRFEGDHTGPYARFPGGVPLVSPSRDAVTFYFYHLFPAWLALGLETVGDESYLRLLALFGSIGLLSLFFIGRRLGGTALGLSLCVVHASFYPQAFFSRFPSSELLAQALFLSGLCVFLRGLGSPDGARRPYVRLAGLLWGALCLCRVDAMPFLWLGLTVVSLLPGRMGIRRDDWAVPMLTTLLFASMAVFHQLANGIDYVGAFSPGRLTAIVSSAVAGRRWPSLVVLAVLAAAGLLVHRCEPTRPRCGWVFAIARAFGLVVSAVTLARFLRLLDWSLVTRHVQWIGMYTTPLVLLVLCGGGLVAVLECFRARPSPGVAVALAFFIGPASCYLIDPMVIAQQPWAMRRFIPVIFPLLFLLSLYGWQAGLRRLLRTRPALSWVAFAGLAVVIAGRFLGLSAGSIGHPVNVRTAADVRSLGRAIPEDALVLIPDENASLHLQLALEYTCGRDVLLLPVWHDPGGRFEEVMNGFLDRRLDNGRRVFLVLTGTSDVAGPFVRHFQLDERFESTLSFEKVPFVPDDVFPGPPVVEKLRSRVLEVRPVRVGR
ncbi:MAG TPA: hypothetical protein VF332_04815 [Vicinamibacterales bacterium]